MCVLPPVLLSLPAAFAIIGPIAQK